MWKNGSWILHHDNAPAHNALSVKLFLAKHKKHPPYSPDLAPCDFFLFPKIKSALKGTRFEPIDAVRVKTMEVMKKLSEKTCSIASNSVKFAWSGVGFGEGTTLKVITFPLCDLLNNRF
jgi:hypothetical protein